ncbi:MAG: glycosyltransferase [Candidatus Rokubacteria bacterium]|nr:glycosyltransferase [Candidatus Rokubacteria bacterium]
MRSLRVLHVMSCRGWSSDAYWAARAVSELEGAGHEAILCVRAGAEGRVGRPAWELGVKRIDTLRLRSGVTPGADLLDLARLRRWLPEVDIVHVHRGKEHWLAALANRLSRSPRPLVRTRHIVQVARAHPGNRWLYQRGTSLVIAVTRAIQQQYVASGLLPPDRVVTLAGGVDTMRFSPGADGRPLRAALGANEGEPLLGMVSGFRVMKGHAVVVEALARLARDRIHPRALLVGRGRHEAAVREAIQRAGLEAQFRFTGFVPDLPRAMAAMDIGLYVPMESDGMGRVIFEFLAMGIPLIASRVGIVPEVLTDSREALLVPAGDPAALAAAIRRLLQDAQLRRALGEAGRHLVEAHYSGARLAERLTSLYAGLLQARSL